MKEIMWPEKWWPRRQGGRQTGRQAGRRQTSWLFTNIAKELNWTRDYQEQHQVVVRMGLAPVTSRFQALHPNSLPLGHAASFTSSWGGHKVHIEMDQFLFTFQWKTYHLTTINKNFNREKKHSKMSLIQYKNTFFLLWAQGLDTSFWQCLWS